MKLYGSKLIACFFFCLTWLAHGETPIEVGPASGMGAPPEREQRCQPQRLNTENLCKHFDDIVDSGVNRDALKQALTFTALNPFLNQDEIMVADYGKNSREKRLFRIDLSTGSVRPSKLSHGSGKIVLPGRPYPSRSSRYDINWGDKDHDGMIDQCEVPEYILQRFPPHLHKDIRRSNMTRPGFFATKQPTRYDHKNHWRTFGANGVNAVPMQGLTEEVNADAEEENVALNAPDYNRGLSRGNVVMGRGSYGPAISPDERQQLMNIEPNTVFYSYVPMCAQDMSIVRGQVPGWESMCEGEGRNVFTTNCSQVNDSGRFLPQGIERSDGAEEQAREEAEQL